MDDFVIKNGVLVKYQGPGGDVVIPEGVTEISWGAFDHCSGLERVTIPAGVTSISNAFRGCKSLTEILVAEDSGAFTSKDGVLFTKDGKTLARFPEGKTGPYAIPEGVTSIDWAAFSGCESLTDLTIPESVISIGDGAFIGCAGLQDEQGLVIVRGVLHDCMKKDTVHVTLPANLIEINSGAFSGCRGLTSVEIQEGVTSIGERAFNNCVSLTGITIPESVTSIGDEAFSGCSGLTCVTIPESVTSIGREAFKGCVGLQDEQGLVVVHGVLYDCVKKDVVDVTLPADLTEIGYSAFSRCRSLACVTIPDGVTTIGERAFSGCSGLTCVTIPDGVTGIGDSAFEECGSLTSVTIPESVTSIGRAAFYSCGNLREVTLPLAAISDRMFGRNGKTIILTVTRPDREPLRAVASFRKDYWAQTWEYEQDYLLPLDESTAQAYDRLVAVGSYEGFQMNEDGRIRAALWRLEDRQLPVSDELRGAFEDFLRQKVNKALKFAEADGRASYIRTLVAVRAINDGNLKKVKKAVSASAVPEIRALADSLAPAAQQPESDESNIEPHLAARLKQINATSVLLKCGVSTLPEVKRTDGTLADADYLRLILAEYVPQNYAGISPLADEAAEKLDLDSLREALMTVYNSVKNEKNQLALLVPLFRYADASAVRKLYPAFRGAAWKEEIGDKALKLSDTREAMLLADKRGLLDMYARMRDTSADALRDTALSSFGLDADGKKVYDLGNKTVTASIGQDLTVALFDETAGKVVKSLPKKGADPEKHAAANADLSDLKKNVKKVAKARSDRLFGDFLSGNTYEAKNWQKVYLGNPVLRRVAELLVWSQGANTFTLGVDGTIQSDGTAYTITDVPISVAHPMEMKAADVAAWQQYYVANGLKQPFEQVWEPVIDPKTIRPERYEGTEVSVFRFMHREKHGIQFIDADFHNEIYFELDGCQLEHERTTWHRHEIGQDETFTLGKFSFKQYDRRVNHIVALLDRWTVAGRILKDDVSVREHLDQFTAAQIMEYIRLATENNCPNCAAMLLEYKQAHYPDFDPMAEFTLE